MKEASARFLDKPARAVRAAERLLDGGDVEFAAGRAYYAMFYVAQALLHQKGLRFRKHGGVHGAFGEHFVKTGDLDPKYHRWLLEAFGKRITGDYGVESFIGSDEVSEMIRQAREFLEEGRRSLGRL